MARLFFGDIPAEPTCSACGLSNPKLYDEETGNRFCDTDCFVESFVINEAEDYAKRIADDRLTEIDD